MTDIASPLPGIFYHKPDPNSAAFKSAGDSVAVGDTIGLIEVMKTFIEVKAEAEGTFSGYAAPDSMPVSAGDVLAKIG